MTRAVPLSDAIDEYVGYMQARRLEHNTIKNARYTLKRCLAVWGNVYVSSIQPRHINRLFAENNWAPRTVNTNLQVIRQFLEWCRNQAYLPLTSDPCFGWRNMKVPEHDKLRVPVEEFGALLDTAEHPRDRGQIAVGLFLFLRGSELQQLHVGDIDFKRSLAHVWRQKTKEDDTLPICEELRLELVRYLNWYRQDQGTLRDEWFLFPAKVKHPWIPDGQGRLIPPPTLASLAPTCRQTHTYRPVKRALEQLGYPVKGEGEHTLRRSGARAYADALRAQGYDGALLRVASMLGHKDTKVTEHYIGWRLEKQQRNEALAGKPMFGDLFAEGQVLKLASEGSE